MFSKKTPSENSPKSNSPSVVIVVALVLGLFILSLVDASYRPIFKDLAVFGLGAYFGGWISPPSEIK